MLKPAVRWNPAALEIAFGQLKWMALAIASHLLFAQAKFPTDRSTSCRIAGHGSQIGEYRILEFAAPHPGQVRVILAPNRTPLSQSRGNGNIGGKG
jgi:hypothetical protein